MAALHFLLAVLACASGAHGSLNSVEVIAEAENSANPVRRVVNMLQKMQKKVSDEGKKEEELYEKFMCYCKTGTADLSATINAAETKIPVVESNLAEAEALLKQLKSELAEHKQDLADAKDAVAAATAQRKKEAAHYAKESADYTANIKAMRAATAAISKGMSGSFLQTTAASKLRQLSIDMDMNAMDRDVLSAFLSTRHSEGYVPQSGQITGILKQMQDTMEKDLQDMIAAEEKGQTDFNALVAAKTKEINANQAAIESKTERSGETEVEIVNLKEDLDDTQKTLAQDKKFLADLSKGCETKTAEWEARSKLRAQELVAIADTIKILNDDDALELFKKTLPAPTLLQTKVNGRQVKKQVINALRNLRKTIHRDSRLDFILLALTGHGKGFEKVLKMIDNMVDILSKEQKDDDEKKAYCEASLDKAEDEKKVLEQSLSDLKKAIEETKDLIATLKDEIASLSKGIADLDSDVTESTATRKAENAFYKTTMAENTAARDILLMAKNRLAKFYTPKLYKAPPKVELSAAGRIESSFSFAQINKHKNIEAPPPPPETWDAYAKKGEEHGGVTEMIQLLVTDLEKEMAEMTVDEKDAQAEYEEFMADSAAKRAADSQSIVDKEGAKADAEAQLDKLTMEHKATLVSDMNKAKQISELHMECDWLIANFETRKEARAGEVESLKQAKAVLSGADFSLMQRTLITKNLRGAQ